MARSLLTRWLTRSTPIRKAHPRVRPQLVALEARDVPAQFNVSTLADNILADSNLSLREAITALNLGNNSGLSTAEKTSVTGTFGVNDTISFLSQTGTITLNGTELPILARSVNIAGTGADKITINANNASRHFSFTTFGTASAMSGLTLTGGKQTNGGAINLNNSAELVLSDMVVSGNSAADGGAVWTGSGTGGKLTVLRSTLSNNTAGVAGGAIWTRTDLSVEASTLSGNTCNSTLFGGAGIVIAGPGRVRTIRNSTFSGNVALANGGAIALETTDGFLTVQNCTIVNNTAKGSSGGGGIARIGGTASIEITSSVVANNSATATNNLNEDIFSAGTVTAVNSAFGTTAGTPTFAASGTTAALVGQNFKLGALGNYGGPVQTVSIAADSPLVDAGSNPAALTTDGRSTLFTRIEGSTDIGAYEAQALSISVSTTADVVDTNYSSGQFSLREVLLFTNANPGPDAIGFNAGVLAGVNSITLTSGELAITGPTTILGPGANLLTVSGNNVSRIFNTTAALSTDVITIRGVTVSGGTNSNGGGGILVGDEQLVLDAVVVQNNTVAGDGGGLFVSAGGSATISHSTFVNNRATFGGAIDFFSNGGSLTLTNSTLTDNTGNVSGGAIYFLGNAGSGVVIRNSTITSNSAGTGGGLYQTSSTKPISIDSTIISGNTASTGPDIFRTPNATGPLTINNSAIGSSAGFTFTGANNLPFGTNLKLGALANNGGPVPTMLPAIDSPVRDAGSNLSNLTTDARGPGFPRLRNAAADIGAVEAAAVLVVRNTDDAGKDSLRQQVLDANTSPGADTITFDTSVFNTAKTITLTSGQLSLSQAVTIIGPGAKLATISGNNASRIFNTSSGTLGEAFVISELTLTAATGGGAFADGGAIYVGDESLTVNDSVIAGNKASDDGAGIYVQSSSGSVTINRSTLSGNIAGNSGGAIYFEFGGALNVNDSTFSNNQANLGGAIGFYGSVGGSGFNIRNSTLAGNSASDAGGGLVVISASNSTYNLQNTTIVNNTASAGGGIGHGTSATFNLQSVIVASNTAPGSPDLFGTQFNVSNSAIGDASGFTFGTGSGNLPTGIDLKLGALQNNGGPTLTFLPAVDSPLRGKGSNPAALTTDQRGFPRSDLGSVDIGAAQLRTTSVASITRQSTALTAASSVKWTVTLGSAVTGLSAANFTLSGAGVTAASIESISGSGSSYFVTAATGVDGDLTLNFANSLGLNLVPTNLPFAGPAYIVNRTPSAVVAISVSDLILSDADVGPSKFALNVIYNEAMDTSSTPVISYPVENPIGSLVASSGSWLTATTYRQFYNVVDLNFALPAIDITVSGGKDLTGVAPAGFTIPNFFAIDTRNPTLVNITRFNPTNTNLAAVSWTVTFSEPITGLGTGNFSLVNGGLTGTPAVSGVIDINGSTYVVSASTGGGEGTLALQLDTVGSIADLNGNPIAALPVNGGAYRIDHVSPEASKLTLNTLAVRDANVGPNGFTATVKYNEPMNQAIAPTVSFPAEFPASLTFNGGVWLDAQTYQAKFNVADLGVEQADIDLRFTGGVDVAGNIQPAFTAVDVFDIDTQNAVIATITSTSPDGTYVPGQTIDITLSFSEDLDLVGTLNVTLDTGAVVTITGPMTGGSFSGTYTVAAGQNSADLTVTAIALASGSTLRDAAGNLASLALPVSNLASNAAIVVGNATVAVSSLIVNDGAVQRSRISKIAVNLTGPATAATLSGITLISSTGATLAVGSGLVVTPVAGNPNSVTLSFTGNTGVEFGSLSDGYWRVNLPAISYTSPQNDVNLRRLFGDINADGTVDGGTDFSGFGTVFGLSVVDSPFDYNGDGAIEGGTDFAEFGSRFGLSL